MIQIYFILKINQFILNEKLFIIIILFLGLRNKIYEKLFIDLFCFIYLFVIAF